MTTHATQLLDDLVRAALKEGADAADAMLVDATQLSVGCRLGTIESLERAESGDLGLRVFVGKRQAVVSATDRGRDTLRDLVERSVAMARIAPEDEYCGLADQGMTANSWPDCDASDDGEAQAGQLIEQARAAEDAAMAVAGVTNSEGAGAEANASQVTLVASNGFLGSHKRTSYGISMTALAGEGTDMQRDYDFASTVARADLPDAAHIGRIAGERAVRRLRPRKMPTGKYPVIFEPRIAGSLFGQLAGAISGSGVARGTSFLKNSLGKAIFGPHVTVVDDPFRSRGLRSRPFDAEGLLPQRRLVIDKGVLTTWLMDLRSSRQLKMASTAHASRGAGGQPSPSPSNFYMEAGSLNPSDLMLDIREGFYVTELMGHGVNPVTGDYSQAAAGFWIEKGIISFPVSEMTIAGNLTDMFLNLTPANDLVFRRGVDAPTVRIEGLTTAGV